MSTVRLMAKSSEHKYKYFISFWSFFFFLSFWTTWKPDRMEWAANTIKWLSLWQDRVTVPVTHCLHHILNTFNRARASVFLIVHDSQMYESEPARHSSIRTKEFYCLLPFCVPLECPVRILLLLLLFFFSIHSFSFKLLFVCVRCYSETFGPDAKWPMSPLLLPSP